MVTGEIEKVRVLTAMTVMLQQGDYRSFKNILGFMQSIPLFSAIRRSAFVAATRPLPTRYSTVPYDVEESPANDELLDDLDEPPAPPAGSFDPPNPNPNNPITTANKPYRSVTELPRYRLHVHSTRNNTITTFTYPNGGTIAWFSGGSCGFKKGNRASYEAGYQCAVRIFKRIEEEANVVPMEVELFFKGFGQGRDALHRALLTTEGQAVRPLVVTITDRTPIKIGGTRAPKTRRL
jgi:small subunit ribosomal protein S11